MVSQRGSLTSSRWSALRRPQGAASAAEDRTNRTTETLGAFTAGVGQLYGPGTRMRPVELVNPALQMKLEEIIVLIV